MQRFFHNFFVLPTCLVIQIKIKFKNILNLSSYLNYITFRSILFSFCFINNKLDTKMKTVMNLCNQDLFFCDMSLSNMLIIQFFVLYVNIEPNRLLQFFLLYANTEPNRPRAIGKIYYCRKQYYSYVKFSKQSEYPFLMIKSHTFSIQSEVPPHQNGPMFRNENVHCHQVLLAPGSILFIKHSNTTHIKEVEALNFTFT